MVKLSVLEEEDGEEHIALTLAVSSVTIVPARNPPPHVNGGYKRAGGGAQVDGENGRGHGGATDILEATLWNTNKMFMSETTSINHKKLTLEFHDLAYSVVDGAAKKLGVGGLGVGASKQLKRVIHTQSGVFRPGELAGKRRLRTDAWKHFSGVSTLSKIYALLTFMCSTFPVAIMGPSGSGKTSLMSVLAGYKTNNLEGQIYVNGKLRNLSTFRKLATYIMQDDILLQDLTVIEAMSFAAQLKLPLCSTKIQKSTRISQILQTMGLESCTRTRTSHLSGGERKRLAIALELITNPPVMFLDEPTSGLDSASCLSCVSLLKSLAHEGGRTIIATIHQPSARIFEQFDALYLLAEGHCLYQGPIQGLVPFFAQQQLHCPLTHNPADFAIEVASGEYGPQWLGKLRKVTRAKQQGELAQSLAQGLNTREPETGRKDSVAAGKTSPNSSIAVPLMNGCVEEPLKLYYSNGTSDSDDELHLYSKECKGSSDSGKEVECGGSGKNFCNQFCVLAHRSFLCISRDLMLNHLRLGSTLIVGLLVGVIFKDAGNSAQNALNNCGGLFFGYLFMIFSAMLTTVLTFPLEREIMIREHLNHWYSLKAYYLARSFADLPFQIFFPILFVCITYFMTDQPRELFRFAIVVCMAVLVSNVCQSIGAFVGALCEVQNSVFIGPISTIPFILFCGIFTKITTVPVYVKWVSYISYVRFTLQSTVYALYGYDRGDLHCELPYCWLKDPKKILEQIEADNISIPEYTLYTIIILLLIRIAIYFALRYRIAAAKQ